MIVVGVSGDFFEFYKVCFLFLDNFYGYIWLNFIVYCCGNYVEIIFVFGFFDIY